MHPSRVPLLSKHAGSRSQASPAGNGAAVISPQPRQRDSVDPTLFHGTGVPIVLRPFPRPRRRRCPGPDRSSSACLDGLQPGHDPPDGHRCARRPPLRELPPQPREPRRLAAVLDGHRRREPPHHPGPPGDVDDPLGRVQPTRLRLLRRARRVCSTPSGSPATARTPPSGRSASTGTTPWSTSSSPSTASRSTPSAAPPRPPRAMNGKHRTWILDDGRSDEVRDLAAELGCHYVRRLSSNGAKAGNINHALSIAKGDFFAILDADFVPKADFLVETLPFFVTRTSPSSRRRRCTATCTPSSPAAPATCRRSSTGSSSPAGTTSTPRSASAPTWSSAARRSTTSAACTPTASPRTCGPR